MTIVIKRYIFIVTSLTILFSGCIGSDDDEETSGSSSGSSTQSCTSLQKQPCIEKFNTCYDACNDSLDCICDCGTVEYNCMKKVGCTEEQAKSMSHVSICDWDNTQENDCSYDCMQSPGCPEGVQRCSDQICTPKSTCCTIANDRCSCPNASQYAGCEESCECNGLECGLAKSCTWECHDENGGIILTCGGKNLCDDGEFQGCMAATAECMAENCKCIFGC